MKRKRSTTDGDERRHKKHKTEHGEEEKKVNDERQRRRTFRDVRKCCTKDLKIMTKTANLCGMIVNKTAEDSKENASKPKAKTGYPEENSFNDAGEKILLRPARNWQDRKALWVEKYGPDTLFVDITKTGEYNRFCPYHVIGGIVLPNCDGRLYTDTVQGFNNKEVISKKDARWVFFIEVYKQVLEKKLEADVKYLREKVEKAPKVVILDTVPNCDVNDFSSEDISAGYLLKCFLEGNYPTKN